MSEILEKLRKVAEKTPSRITTKEREWLVSLSADYGVHINPLCPNCYKDAAIQLYAAIHKEEQQTADAGGWALTRGTDILFNGERICAATWTEENAKRWYYLGLPRWYFANIPAEYADNSRD